MLRRTIYLRRTANGSIERCTFDDASAPSRDEIYRNGPWTPTALSKTTEYEEGCSFEQLFARWAKIDAIEEIEKELKLDVQLRIGRILYKGLFGDTPSIGDRWVHLVPLIAPGNAPLSKADSEFLDLVCHLPWSFLTTSNSDRASFLVRAKAGAGAVTIDAWPARGGSPTFETKLPRFPNVLAIIPLNTDVGDKTLGEEHWDVISTALKPHYADPNLAGGLDANPDKLVCAHTFDEFQNALANAWPDIVYFYGHAKPSAGSTGFWFDTREGKGDFVDVGAIRLALQEWLEAGRPAPVVWVNACQGSAAQRHNFLRQLSPLAATVVTTRTLAAVDDSRAIAEKALPLIVRDGRPPHSAIRDILAVRAPPVLSARWATTVISVQYEWWSALGPEKRVVADLESAGDFPMRMDRSAPLARLSSGLSDGFTRLQSGLQVAVWKGSAEQSLDVFTRRFVDHLSEEFPSWTTIEFRVELQVDARPAGFSDHNLVPSADRKPAPSTDHNLASILVALLGRQLDPSDIGTVNHARIGSEISRILPGRRTILLFIHGPFTSSNLAAIGDYISDWRTLRDALNAKTSDVQVVLGFAFDDEETVVSSSQPSWEGTIMEALGAVPAPELSDHLKKFRLFYNLSEAQADVKAQELVESKRGFFRPIHAELERMAKIFRWSRRNAK